MDSTEKIVSEVMNILQNEYDIDGLENLGAQTARDIAAQIDANDGCALRTCSYYAHYLVYYAPTSGEKLEHEAFHVAEKNCNNAQKRVLDWYDANEGNNKTIPPLYERQADFWERKVCA